MMDWFPLPECEKQTMRKHGPQSLKSKAFYARTVRLPFSNEDGLVQSATRRQVSALRKEMDFACLEE